MPDPMMTTLSPWLIASSFEAGFILKATLSGSIGVRTPRDNLRFGAAGFFFFESLFFSWGAAIVTGALKLTGGLASSCSNMPTALPRMSLLSVCFFIGQFFEVREIWR